MTNSVRYALAAAAVALLSLAVAGCGGNDGPSPTPQVISGRAIVQIALDPPVAAETVTNTQNVIKARLDAAGLTSTLTPASEAQIAIDFQGPRSINFVSELVSTLGVRFKEPVLEGAEIKCVDTSGEEFLISTSQLQPQEDSNLPVCVDIGQHRGEIVWQDAVENLTGEQVLRDTVVVREQDGETTLLADFNDEGKAALQEVTADLIGFPLGVFLGDSLKMTPLIQREIDNGRVTLQGATLEGFEQLDAVMSGGELPAPVNLVSIEQQ
jgi:preprotein translocase subunit SecD